MKCKMRRSIKIVRHRLALAMGMLLILACSLALAQDYHQLPPPKLGALPGDTTPSAPQPGSTEAPKVPEKPLPPVTITASVEQPRVPQHERFNFIVTISWDQSAGTEEYPLDFEFPDPPAAEGMVLYANSFKAETRLQGDRIKVVRAYTYEFYAETKGPTEIKPVAVKYFRIGSDNKKELKTQAVPVEVVKAKVHLGPILRHPAALAGYVVAVLAIGALLARSWVRGRRAGRVEEGPARTPQEIARERLGEADRFRMAGDYVEFLRALGLEMRRFCEDALGVRVRSASGAAFAQAVSDRLGPEWKDRIDEFEKLADKVKFAGYGPTSPELDAAMATATALVAEVEKLLPAEEKV